MITKYPASRTLIIHPLGDLDALRAEHYRHQLRSLIDEDYRFLIFDLQDTPFINSSGLGLLVEFYNTVTRLDGSLKLINCSPHAFWLLEQTHLDKIFFSEQEPSAASPRPIPSVQFDPLHALMSDEILLLSQVHEATEKILRLDDPQAIGQVILQGIIKALRAARGALFLLSDDERQLNLVQWQGRTPEEPAPPIDEIPLKIDSWEYQILQQGEVTCHHLDDKPEAQHKELFRKLGFAFTLAAPIRSHQHKYGLLLIEAGDETGRIIQAAKPLVSTFTNLCGLALEKTTMMLKFRHQNEELNGMISRARDYHQSLIHGGRLATLGVVASGLGHMINNKMVPLIGYSQILMQKQDLPPGLQEKISRILQSGNEVNQVIEKLVRISRTRDVARQPIRISQLLRTAVDLLSDMITQGRISIRINPGQDPEDLLGDSLLLLQALLAVLHRACTSFSNGQTQRAVRIITSADAKNLRIVIEDNGDPFGEYDQEDWLDPLVPTEAMNQGQIFTYTIPRRILHRFRGTLELEPRTETGKRVIIDLPLGPPPSTPS